MRQNFAYGFAETHNLNLEVRLKLSHLPLGNLPDLFGTWVVETQITFIGPKEVLHGKILTRKELYRVGRVEKSKNGIKSYGLCFSGGLWYIKTKGKNFGSHRKFFVGLNFT